MNKALYGVVVVTNNRTGHRPENYEVTFDPEAGETFVSHNGAPIDAGPIQEEIVSEGPTEEPPLEETETEEEEESSYSPHQQAAIDKLTSMGLPVEKAFAWADSDESTSDDSYNRLSDALGDSDPAVVELAALAVGFAHRSDSVVGDETPYSEFSQSKNKLYRCDWW